ncbi:unnamed protein product, partial [Arabidopsis halleri]
SLFSTSFVVPCDDQKKSSLYSSIDSLFTGKNRLLFTMRSYICMFL